MDGLTAVVLRRVAAALAGVRVSTDTPVTVVVTKDAEPRVAVCATAAETQRAVKEFGGARKVQVIKDCLVPAGPPSHEWQVQQVEVTYGRVRDGRLETKRVSIDAARHDAFFWSPAAVEKFLVPHYAGVYGPAYAASLQESYATQTTDTLVHERLSQYVPADGTVSGTTLTMAPEPTPLPPPQA